MAFIGIITSKKNESLLKNMLIRTISRLNLDEKIIIINENSIENIKNIKFDTIIINEENKCISDKKQTLKQILGQSKYLILNSDFFSDFELIDKLKLNIITFGLNLKATVTASSIEEDKISIYIQREIKNYYNQKIEPKEVTLELKNNYMYGHIIAYIFKIIYDEI